MNRVADYATAVSECIRAIDGSDEVPRGLSIGGAIILQLLLIDRTRLKAGILVNPGAKLKVMPLIFETLQKRNK